MSLTGSLLLTQRAGGILTPVHVGDGIVDGLGELAVGVCTDGRPSVVCVIHDSGARAFAERAMASLERAGLRVAARAVHAMERSKTLATVEELSRGLASAGADRDALVVAVGGGIVGDVAGFVAASWMRGVRWIQVPTTLLGMVDAALGGKTAVNLELADGTLAKNMVGAIWQPRAVVSDVSSLASLPERALRAGLAECVKHAILADAGLLEELASILEARRPDAQARGAAVRAVARAAQVKLDIVARDEREHGERMLLNLGHTFAHAIEACEPDRWLHGEAVAIGLVAAMGASAEHGQIRADGPWPSGRDIESIRSVLLSLGLPTGLAPDAPWERMREAMRADKKRRGGGLTLILPRGGAGAGAAIVRDAPDIVVDAGLAAIGMRSLKPASANVR
ncbi:MAG: 3-dehydroquinate synthase [Phycisphaerales bacterium]|nr:3-dehydroquinate synthase [Phycisphaerales bacterium]